MDGWARAPTRRARQIRGGRLILRSSRLKTLRTPRWSRENADEPARRRRVPTANASVRPGMVAVVLHAAPLPTMQGINFLSEATG